LNAVVSDGKLHIEIDSGTHAGYTFAFSDDTSNALAALGINTFFTGADAINMRVNDTLESNKDYIAAARINNNVGPAVGASGNTSTGIITTAGPYTGSADAVYEIQITTDGSTFQWRKDGGAWSGDTAIAGSPALGAEGVTATFNGAFVLGDTFTIDVTESSNTYGAFASGDNANALAVADLQYEPVTIKRWLYERGTSATSRDVTGTTIESYLHGLVGSVGISSQSVKREQEYKEVVVAELNRSRDNYSAVSLDEEMAEMIKFQHAFTAAAKLITAAEEMLDTLLQMK
jgi:flagellar hook-associated protein 1 FlgK